MNFCLLSHFGGCSTICFENIMQRRKERKICQNDKITIFIGRFELVTVHISYQHCNVHKDLKMLAKNPAEYEPDY